MRVCLLLCSLQVGLQRALVRDTAHLFCVLAVTHLQSVKRERALLSGVVSSSVAQQSIEADEIAAFCDQVSTAASGPSDKSTKQNNSPLVSCRQTELKLVERNRVPILAAAALAAVCCVCCSAAPIIFSSIFVRIRRVW